MIELPHVCLLIWRRDCSRLYGCVVHFKKKKTTARADPQPPLQPTHRQRKTFRPLLVAPLKLRKGRNVLPSCVLVATGCCVPQPHNLGGWNHQPLIGGEKPPPSRDKSLLRIIKKKKKRGLAFIWGRVSQRAALFLNFFQKNVDECMIELPHVCLLILRRECSRFWWFEWLLACLFDSWLVSVSPPRFRGELLRQTKACWDRTRPRRQGIRINAWCSASTDHKHEQTQKTSKLIS